MSAPQVEVKESAACALHNIADVDENRSGAPTSRSLTRHRAGLARCTATTPPSLRAPLLPASTASSGHAQPCAAFRNPLRMRCAQSGLATTRQRYKRSGLATTRQRYNRSGLATTCASAAAARLVRLRVYIMRSGGHLHLVSLITDGCARRHIVPGLTGARLHRDW